jgi:hypothetical protein
VPSLLGAGRSYSHLYWDYCDRETEHVGGGFRLLASPAERQAGLVSERLEFEQLALGIAGTVEARRQGRCWMIYSSSLMTLARLVAAVIGMDFAQLCSSVLRLVMLVQYNVQS